MFPVAPRTPSVRTAAYRLMPLAQATPSESAIVCEMSTNSSLSRPLVAATPPAAAQPTSSAL